MANLRTLSSKSDQIVLGKGGVSNIGNVIGLIVFVVIACAGLSSVIDQGGDFNPVFAIIALVIGFALLNAILSSLRSTRVIIDANQQRAARVDSILFLPYNSRDMAFNLIRNVRLSMRGNTPFMRGVSAMPLWQVTLEGTDGSSFLLNDGGTRSEMQNLGQQVSTLINRPLRDAAQETTSSAAMPAASPTPSASESVASLLGTLNAFTQSNSTPLSPTFSAYPTLSAPTTSQAPPTQNRSQRRSRASQNAASAAPPKPPANTLVTAAATLVPDTLYSDMTTPTTLPQSAVELFNTPTPPPVLYSAPPVLVMPAMPALPSFAPALNMPSFAPIGAAMPAQVTTLPDIAETKEVQAEPVQTLPNNINELQRMVAQDPQNADAQYRLARRLYSSGNLPAAESAYQRALSVNPSNAAVQNDLGVLYMQQNKWRHAETALRRATALDPTASTSRYNLGLVLIRTGGRRGAMEQFRVGAQSADPENAPYFENALRGSLNAPLLSPEQ